MNDIAAVTSAPQFTQLATDDTTPSFTHSAGIPASPDRVGDGGAC